MSGKNVEESKMQIGEALDSYKQNLMGNCYEGSEEQCADRHVDSESRAHGVSEGNKDWLENLTRGHSYYILIESASLHSDILMLISKVVD